MITQILNYYQEQIIFEEALAILQEKKVDLENLFVFAYQRLGINMDKPEENQSDQNDSGPSFSVVTDASLGSVSGYGDGYFEPEEENHINPGSNLTQFKKKNAGIVQSDRIGPAGSKLDHFHKGQNSKKTLQNKLPPGNIFELDFNKIIRDEVSENGD